MNAVHNQNEKSSIATTYNKFLEGVDMNDMMSFIVLLYSDDFSNIQDEYPFYIFLILS
jgi:hypothetical protein